VDLQIRILLWLVHDVSAPYFRLAVLEFLKCTFPEQWISPGGPTAWPTHSLDFVPLDFYFWRHLQTVVYATGVSDVQDL
jgi:hypothetical protein